MRAYSVEYEAAAERFFKKADPYVRKSIVRWITENIDGCENPRVHGKALSENLAWLWRYRVGDYRIIAEIDDDRIVVVVVQIGHRSDVYGGR